MKKLICKIIGHKYKYNFVSFPSKCSCTRCGDKWKTINNPEYVGDLKEPIFIWIKDE